MTDLRRQRPQAPPIGAALRPFRTPVRGHAFATAPPGAALPAPGTPVRLAREPDNPADPLAVAVWIDASAGPPWRIGYLDRQVAARLGPRIDRGLRLDARLDGWAAEPQGRWRRPVVQLRPGTAAGAPVLPAPPPRPRRAADDAAPGLWGRPPGCTVRPVGPG